MVEVKVWPVEGGKAGGPDLWSCWAGMMNCFWEGRLV